MNVMNCTCWDYELNRYPTSVTTPVQQPPILAISPVILKHSTINQSITTMAKSAKIVEIQMQLALDACRNVIDPNFSNIAHQFPPVNRQTLRRRFIRTQGSRASANSIHRQNLTNEQKDELIKLINSLTLRGLPLTSAIV